MIGKLPYGGRALWDHLRTDNTKGTQSDTSRLSTLSPFPSYTTSRSRQNVGREKSVYRRHTETCVTRGFPVSRHKDTLLRSMIGCVYPPLLVHSRRVTDTSYHLHFGRPFFQDRSLSSSSRPTPPSPNLDDTTSPTVTPTGHPCPHLIGPRTRSPVGVPLWHNSTSPRTTSRPDLIFRT